MPRNKQAEVASRDDAKKKDKLKSSKSNSKNNTNGTSATKAIKKKHSLPRSSVKKDTYGKLNSETIFAREHFLKVVKKCIPSSLRISKGFVDYLIKVVTNEQVLITKESNGLRKHRGQKKILEASDYVKALSVLGIVKGDDVDNRGGGINQHEGELNGNTDMN